MTIRVVDVETTGVDPEHDAVVEIASVDVLAGGTITEPMETLVNPGMGIPPDASAVHHIMDEDVHLAPFFRDAIGQFMGADFYVAHNSKFEMAFLGDQLGKDNWVCTFKCALRVWPDFPSHSNQALRYRLGLVHPFGQDRCTIVPHRAAGDAIVTAGIFVALTKAAKWSDMVRWSAEPALHTVFSFGKHRGQKYTAVDQSYLRWIIDKSDLDADVKFSAQHALNQHRDGVVPARDMVPA